MTRMAVFCVAAVLMAIASPATRAQPTPGASGSGDPLSAFGLDVSSAVDRAADLAVYASLCGVGSEAAAVNLREAVSRRIAACFRSDSKAATWLADVLKHFDGRRGTTLDVARSRGRNAVCGRLFEDDGKTLTPFGREVAADGKRYAASAVAAPIASRACP